MHHVVEVTPPPGNRCQGTKACPSAIYFVGVVTRPGMSEQVPGTMKELDG
jgi:hypothetical protein